MTIAIFLRYQTIFILNAAFLTIQDQISFMKVLICENEEILITAIEFRLRKYGMSIMLAKSIKKAVQQIQKEMPRLVIIDQELADGAGIDLIRKLRHDMDLADLPIILIAELENEEAIQEGFDLNIQDFVTKPFKPTELALRALRLAR